MICAHDCDQRVSMSVCLSVCPLAQLKNHTSEFHQIFCTCVTCGRDSVLLWRQRDTLCTSGFIEKRHTFIQCRGHRPESKTILMFPPVRVFWALCTNFLSYLLIYLFTYLLTGGEVCRLWLHHVAAANAQKSTSARASSHASRGWEISRGFTGSLRHGRRVRGKWETRYDGRSNLTTKKDSWWTTCPEDVKTIFHGSS